ncbi:MAG: hypothetical protein WC145_12165 [Aliarcobacter sp.]|jgi:hypothetical protein|nr:hypothetical protein [Candidatus Cloacimonadaceae bacterium]
MANEESSNIPPDARQGLRDRISDLNPSLVLLQKLDRLGDEGALSDLTQQQVVVIAYLQAANEIGLLRTPGSLAFCETYKNLIKSRDRLGRYEFRDALKGRSVIHTDPATGTAVEIRGNPQQTEERPPRRSFWDRLRRR